jgi:hypothetical protein
MTLLRRVKSAILFVANVRCAKSGEPLFSRRKAFSSGCVSDMPDFDCHCHATNPSGKQKPQCVRGTSKHEGFHKHLKDMFSACHASPPLAACFLAVFVHRWNHDRAVERRLVPERCAGFHQHKIVHEMQLVSAEFEQPHFHEDLARQGKLATCPLCSSAWLSCQMEVFRERRASPSRPLKPK